MTDEAKELRPCCDKNLQGEECHCSCDKEIDSLRSQITQLEGKLEEAVKQLNEISSQRIKISGTFDDAESAKVTKETSVKIYRPEGK